MRSSSEVFKVKLLHSAPNLVSLKSYRSIYLWEVFPRKLLTGIVYIRDMSAKVEGSLNLSLGHLCSKRVRKMVACSSNASWLYIRDFPFFVKLVQLAQFDKTNHALQFMELVIVEAQIVQKAKWPNWQSIQFVILGLGSISV